jgi:hypothetical protein
MKASTTLASLAGPSALLAAAVLLPFWYIHLFVGMPSGLEPMQAALEQIKFDISSESKGRVHLLMWAAAPIGWTIVGVGLLLLKTTSKAIARTLLSGSVALAVVSIALAGWETTILFGVPVWLCTVRLRVLSQATGKP